MDHSSCCNNYSANATMWHNTAWNTVALIFCITTVTCEAGWNPGAMRSRSLESLFVCSVCVLVCVLWPLSVCACSPAEASRDAARASGAGDPFFALETRMRYV